MEENSFAAVNEKKKKFMPEKALFYTQNTPPNSHPPVLPIKL